MLDVGLNLLPDRRRERLLLLIEEQKRAGMLEAEMAAMVGTTKQHFSNMKKGAANIGNTLSARFERAFAKPEGWMDQPFNDHEAAKSKSIADAMAVLVSALGAAGDIGRLKVSTMLARLADATPTDRLRYAAAIATELGEPPQVTWESVCRESVALLDDSVGKQKVIAYLELVDANYQHIMQSSAKQPAKTAS